LVVHLYIKPSKVEFAVCPSPEISTSVVEFYNSAIIDYSDCDLWKMKRFMICADAVWRLKSQLEPFDQSSCPYK
jgi:hypothetical protein